MKIRAGFPLVVVMNSVVDCNEMSIAANTPFLCNLGPAKTCQLARTWTYKLYTNILFCSRCKLINASDQMGPFHILLEEMGLARPNGIKVGRPLFLTPVFFFYFPSPLFSHCSNILFSHFLWCSEKAQLAWQVLSWQSSFYTDNDGCSYSCQNVCWSDIFDWCNMLLCFSQGCTADSWLRTCPPEVGCLIGIWKP